MTELFYAVLKASFQGSIVILAVILLRQLLKKAPRSVFCLLWLLAGLRLLLPFEIESRLSLQPQMKESELSIQVQLPVQTPSVTLPAQDTAQPEESPSPANPGNYENWQSESFLYQVEDGVISPITLGDIAAQIWLLGMGIMLAASAVSYWKLKRRVRMAYLIENGCYECPGLETAFVLGFLPPRIYLPSGLTDQEKKFIFDHENTHIARHDHWYKLLGYLVLSLHWFNPLVWIGYALLCRDIELACDEHVIKYMSLPERKAYSAALLSCGGHTAGLAACPVSFGESDPKQRILNVLNYKRPTFWISLTAVVAVAFVALCLLTSPAEDEPTERIHPDPPENAAELEETVRKLLADYGNQYVVNFRSEAEFKVDEFLDTWVFRQGNDWYTSEKYQDETVIYAVLDGVGHTREGILTDASAQHRQPDHWMLTTDWTNVEMDIIWAGEDGRTIECTVLAPFTVNGETAPDYWLQVNLDRTGALSGLTQRVLVDEEQNGKTVSRQLKEESITIRPEDATHIAYIGVSHGENEDIHFYELSDVQVSMDMYLCLEISPEGINLSTATNTTPYSLCTDESCADGSHEHHPAQTLSESDYLAMCRNAVADIQNRGTYHISETLVYYVNEQEDARSHVAFWRDGENLVRQSYVTRIKQTRTHLYYGGQLYYRVQEDSGEPSWSLVETDHGAEYGLTWLHLLDWDAQIVTFEYAEQVEDMLHVFVTVHSTPQTLGWDDVNAYTVGFFFDQAGNLDSAIMGCIREEINVVSELKIEDTADTNIRNQVKQFADQRPAELVQESDAEYVEKCREAMMNLKNSEELYLYISSLDDPMATTNVYMHASNGWLFQYRRPGWDCEAVQWLRLGNAQYIYGGDMDENGVMTTPYYWQVEQQPESHDFQLPYPFDLDWENIELTYGGTASESGADAVTILFPLHMDVFTFHFNDAGELLYFDLGDSSGEPEATTSRFYVQFPYDGTVADYLTGLYEEASAQAGQKPGIPDDAFYEELFARKTDGHYTEQWVYDLFLAFYAQPEEFVSRLAMSDRAEEITTLMGYSLESYAPYRFASVLTQLREDPNTDPTILALLDAIG